MILGRMPNEAAILHVLAEDAIASEQLDEANEPGKYGGMVMHLDALTRVEHALIGLMRRDSVPAPLARNIFDLVEDQPFALGLVAAAKLSCYGVATSKLKDLGVEGTSR